MAASGDGHDDTVTAVAIAEQMRLWAPTQVEVVSLAQQLGIGQPGVPDPRMQDPHAPLLPHTSLEVVQMMAGTGWTVTNGFRRAIDPWSPTGFSGVVAPRY